MMFFLGLTGGLFYAIPPVHVSCSQRQGILRLLFGPPEHTASQNRKPCHFRGTCWPFESLEQNPIERFHAFSFAFSSFRSVTQFGNLPSKWNATNVLPQMTFNTVSVRCAGLYGEMYTIVVRENRPSTPTP